ncbi:hypothetical protein EYC80_005277 [Monilinia laxa]|uniref:Uncharacterized protein n=1 Tax=Monilinia laxa TaxID=61186 RepID=A0A5N6KJG2_MONLA|nr:hypothetical protein EYC80_005277 [Monilinia laxa]
MAISTAQSYGDSAGGFGERRISTAWEFVNGEINTETDPAHSLPFIIGFVIWEEGTIKIYLAEPIASVFLFHLLKHSILNQIISHAQSRLHSVDAGLVHAWDPFACALQRLTSSPRHDPWKFSTLSHIPIHKSNTSRLSKVHFQLCARVEDECCNKYPDNCVISAPLVYLFRCLVMSS